MTNKSRKTALSLTKKVQIISRRIYTAGKWGAVLFAFFSILYTGYKIKAYFDSHIFKWQSPVIIKFQLPLIILDREREAKRQKGTIEGVKMQGRGEKQANLSGSNKLFEDFFYTIHVQESGQGTNTNGLNGYCIDKGGLNEVGFAPHLNYCFKDRNDQKKTVLLWLYNRLGTKCMTISECLGLYSNQSYTTLLVKP